MGRAYDSGPCGAERVNRGGLGGGLRGGVRRDRAERSESTGAVWGGVCGAESEGTVRSGASQQGRSGGGSAERSQKGPCGAERVNRGGLEGGLRSGVRRDRAERSESTGAV